MRLVVLLLIFLLPRTVISGEVTVALASNVHEPLQQIAQVFEAETGHKVRLVNGATGKLYAQILRGAPFDLFLAADQARPALLYKAGESIAPPVTYAIGQLVLWSADPRRVMDEHTLTAGNFRRLAIADPALAPYGLAAEQALRALGAWETVSGKLVMGENIGQTFAFTATGNAELGLVALSYVKSPSNPGPDTGWLVPGDLHDPIRQDMVVLQRAKDNEAARVFAAYLTGKTAKDIFASFGYLGGND
ncbi:MAG: molybdate ABC transporter substrate-binding protein [Brevirhabdus sp.]